MTIKFAQEYGSVRGTAAATGLKLRPGTWYGMTMWPGYGDEAYHSPTRIEEMDEIGDELIVINFYNAAYAGGVRDFAYPLLPLVHEPQYLIASLDHQPGRTVAIVPLTPKWLQTYFPDQFARLKVIAACDGASLEIGIERLSREWGAPEPSGRA